MDTTKLTGMKHATLSARPVGSRGDPATKPSAVGGLPIAGAMAVGGAGAGRPKPSAIAAEGGKKVGRPTKDERKKERRMEVMADIDDLVDNKPTKSKVRIYLLTRIQELLEERGITTA